MLWKHCRIGSLSLFQVGDLLRDVQLLNLRLQRAVLSCAVLPSVKTIIVVFATITVIRYVLSLLQRKTWLLMAACDHVSTHEV